MKKPQWLTVGAALILVILLYTFGRTVPVKKKTPSAVPSSDAALSTDSILAQSRRKLNTEQLIRLDAIEKGTGRGQPLLLYHRLAHFWSDTAQLFEPYAWYEAEAARLENSEKSLTFAAHLFLQNLRGEGDPAVREWKAEQATDLFERSLKINPGNDSSIVGLGACSIFGGAEAPMEGILKVRSVADRDSTNIFAQEVLGHASMMSGQYDRAIARFETVFRLADARPDTKIEACLMLGEAYERKSDRKSAIVWYQHSLTLVKNDQVKAEILKRINELK